MALKVAKINPHNSDANVKSTHKVECNRINLDNSRDVFDASYRKTPSNFGEFLRSKINGIKENKNIEGIKGSIVSFGKSIVKHTTPKNDSPNIDNETYESLKTVSNQLCEKYESGVTKIEEEYKKHFDGLKSVEKITSRAKGQKSVHNKLIEKFKKGLITSTDFNSCAKEIGDGMGVRVQLKSLTPEEAKDIIEESLKGTGKTYDDFILAIESKQTLSEEYMSVIDNLKEAQTDEFVDALCDKIKSGDIEMSDEFNNYGDEVTSYFSNKQLRKIGIAYEEATGMTPTFINKTPVAKDGTYVKFGDSKPIFNTNTEKATKTSGYPTAQANAVSSVTNGIPMADTEFQVRGIEANKYADIEHIIYDIKQGKISATDSKYSDVYDILKGLSKESYNDFCKYSSDVYRYLRLKELGIPTSAPSSPNALRYSNKKKLIEAGLDKLCQKAGQKLTKDELVVLEKRQLLNYCA